MQRSQERHREPEVKSGCPPCPESQADGVPCDELGRDCDDCDRAHPDAEVAKTAQLIEE